MSDTPELVTEFIEGGGPLGGVGEVGPVTLTPALANADPRRLRPPTSLDAGVPPRPGVRLITRNQQWRSLRST